MEEVVKEIKRVLSSYKELAKSIDKLVKMKERLIKTVNEEIANEVREVKRNLSFREELVLYSKSVKVIAYLEDVSGFGIETLGSVAEARKQLEEDFPMFKGLPIGDRELMDLVEAYLLMENERDIKKWLKEIAEKVREMKEKVESVGERMKERYSAYLVSRKI